MASFKWTNVTVKLGQLKPWEDNPRLSTERQADLIQQSHRDFGQVDVFAIGPMGSDGKYPLYNGHQRYFAWLAEYGPDFEVDARQSSRALDVMEQQALTAYLHAGAVGSWDTPALANWGWDAETWASFGVDFDFTKSMHNTAFEFEGLIVDTDEFKPVGADEQPRLDRKEPVICPHCGKNIHDEPEA